MLIGIPSMSVPLVQGLQTPKIALFSEELNQGVAKLAGTAYDPETGELVASSGPRYGFSHKAEWTALLVVRSETRRVGTEGVSTGRARWSSDHKKKHKTT